MRIAKIVFSAAALSLAWCAAVPGMAVGECTGGGCSDPCPAANSCVIDADCPGDLECTFGSGSGDCFPSACVCIDQRWICTEDCVGECVPAVPVPTVSQWGLILMTLLLIATATLVFGRQSALPGAGVGPTWGGLSFVPTVYWTVLAGILALELVIAASLWVLWGRIDATDLVGALLCAPLAAYPIHVWLSSGDDRRS